MLDFITMQMFFIALIQLISWTPLSDEIKNLLYSTVLFLGISSTAFYIYNVNKSA